MTKKETNLSDTLSEAVSVATSVAYTRQEIQKLKKEFVSLLEEKATEVIVEQVPGPIGPRGSIGANGAQGLKGDRGEVGERGEKGEVGESGSQGDVGQDGLRGEKGEQGDTGLQGVAGEIGQQGPKGDKGDDGKNGLDGRDGETGEMGPVGLAGQQGIQGEQGLRGDKGDRGERGENGQQGIQGSTGLRGESGQQGIQGVAGKDGKDADIKPAEEKFKKFQDVLEKDLQQYKNRINASVSKAMATDMYKSAGSGEVNLRYLDDIDRDSIQDGYVLSYDSSAQKFVFVEQTGGSGGSGNGTVDFSAGRLTFGSGGTSNNIDTFARTTANTALSIANSAFAQANTGGAAGTDNVARSIANSAFSTANASYSQANTATSLAQAAYNQANNSGNVIGPASATDNTIVRYDSTTGKLIQSSLVSIADDGAITAPQVGNMIPFYYPNQAAFPSASTSHGALAHSHADGAMYFAHGGVWIKLLDSGTVVSVAQGGTGNANPSLIAGTNVTITGAWPNQTINASGNNGSGGITESLNVAFDNDSATQYKVVALNSNGETILASASNIGQVDKIIGILNNVDETVTFGSITNQAWNWITDQSLYLGSNGDIVTTSTINGGAFSLKLGYAISSTKAFIKIGTPIVL